MKLGVGQRALAIAAFGFLATAFAAPAAADTASEIRALKARLSKLEADEARAKREAKAAAQHAVAGAHAAAAGSPPAPQHWYERLSLRGYTQMRYNDILNGGPFYNGVSTVGDKSVGPRQNFFIRRARMILSGDVSDHLYLYFQNDFASSPSGTFSNSATFNAPTSLAGQAVYYYYNPVFPYPGYNQVGNYSSAPGNFGQIRDLYADIYFDKDKEFRVRAGQSKIPFAFENLQSSQNRLALDRADAVNSCCKDERDLGLFFYYTPKHLRPVFRDLVKNNLKGSGDYGMVGFGVYNGQGANRIELNKGTHLVARFTYPYVFENGQVVEASVAGYTGRFVPYTTGIRPSLGGGTNWAGFVPLNIPYSAIGAGFTPYVAGSGWNNLGNYQLSQYGAVNGWGPFAANGGNGVRDSRVVVNAVIYPQPFGLRAEWNWGVGPQLNATQTAIEAKRLTGGYVEASYKYEDKEFGTGVYFPFVKWQYYNGGSKFDNNAPMMRIYELEAGVEYQPLPELEFTVNYSKMDRTNTQAAPYRQFQANLVRMQLQWNY
ncbi:MAG: hypothetical protein FJX06_05600 [Alphaproteobacteria bacterium]|nr:hypothetical protein [Alphaproteobacteria bacterium]